MSMNSMLPITARVFSKLFANADVFDRASETIELEPAVDRDQNAAISLPDEFDRVSAIIESSTLDLELARLRRGSRRHAATIAYRLDHAVLAEGSLYFNGGYKVLRAGSKALLPRRREHFQEMALCTDYVIERYFGHWLIDGLALEVLADQMSLRSLILTRKPWLHEQDYRQMSGLEANQTNHAVIERLWVVDDRGINNSRISRFKKLRERIRPAGSQTGKRIWLGRGKLGAARNLVNSTELCEVLQRLGFEMIEAEHESAGNIVKKLASAEIVITIEGSAQSHCSYALPTGSTLLIIQPPARFNASSKDRADAVGFNWAYVVADPRPNGFHLPVDRLMRTLEEISRVTLRRIGT
jgi:hypothetical protein